MEFPKLKVITSTRPRNAAIDTAAAQELAWCHGYTSLPTV